VKLYVAIRSYEYEYEGFDILGIYNNEANALTRVDLDIEEERGDNYDVLHFELNKDEEM